MIFIDTNVIMYAVGGEHPRRAEAQEWLETARREALALASSAEVGQELIHAYLGRGRLDDLDEGLAVWRSFDVIWPVEAVDVVNGRALFDSYPQLAARDLIHLACCRRRRATGLKTFDMGLAEAFEAESAGGSAG